MNRNKMILSALAFLAFIIAIVFVAVSNSKPLPEKLRDTCLKVMQQGGCVIMHNEAYIPFEVKQIFIAGYGNLSADTFRSLKNADVLMCDMIREACSKDVESEVCRLGKAMYLQ